MWLPNLFSLETGKEVQRRLKFWQEGRLREIEERYVELSEKCVGWSVAKGKRGKKRQKVDNAYIFLSYLIMQQKCATNYF